MCQFSLIWRKSTFSLLRLFHGTANRERCLWISLSFLGSHQTPVAMHPLLPGNGSRCVCMGSSALLGQSLFHCGARRIQGRQRFTCHLHDWKLWKGTKQHLLSCYPKKYHWELVTGQAGLVLVPAFSDGNISFRDRTFHKIYVLAIAPFHWGEGFWLDRFRIISIILQLQPVFLILNGQRPFLMTSSLQRPFHACPLCSKTPVAFRAAFPARGQRAPAAPPCGLWQRGRSAELGLLLASRCAEATGSW